MIGPFHRGISHTEIDLSSFLEVTVSCLLSDFHSAIEVLSGCVEVALLCKELSKLQVCARLSLTVLEFVRQLKIALDEHLHLVLVQHRCLHILATDLTKVSNCN
jgi:hypothetical protein